MYKSPRKRVDAKGHVRWQARVVVGINPRTGRRIEKAETFSTKALAEKWLRDARGQVERGDWADAGGATVGSIVTEWLETNRGGWSARTADRYRGVVENHILPAWRYAPIASVKPSKVQAWILSLRENGRVTGEKRTAQGGLSVDSLRYVRSALHQAFGAAVTDGLLTRNPIDAVRLPQARPRRVVPMSVVDLRAIIEASAEHRMHAFFVLALTTGARAGELLGARWQDFDLEGAAVWRIEHSLQRVTGQGLVLGPPKTESSQRRVELPAAAGMALVAHGKRQAAERLRAGSLWRDAGFVFCSELGAPLDESNVYRRVWLPMLDKAGVERRRLHDARHSHASLLIAQGEALKVVQERLGHADPRTTEALYVHLYADAHRQAADRLDALFGRGDGTENPAR